VKHSFGKNEKPRSNPRRTVYSLTNRLKRRTRGGHRPAYDAKDIRNGKIADDVIQCLDVFNTESMAALRGFKKFRFIYISMLGAVEDFQRRKILF